MTTHLTIRPMTPAEEQEFKALHPVEWQHNLITLQEKEGKVQWRREDGEAMSPEMGSVEAAVSYQKTHGLWTEEERRRRGR